MDDIEDLRNGIGAIAEIMLIFWDALIEAGADEETAVMLTSIFVESMKSEDE